MYTKLLILLISLSTISCSQVILNEPFNSNSYQSNFNRQCSYLDSGCSKHYGIEVISGTPMLRISIYNGDKEFSEGSSTDPRTELRSVKNLINSNIAYTITWDVYIKTYNSGYSFCFLQIFNDIRQVPDIMLRWENNQYSVWSDQKHTVIKGTLSDDLHQKSTWKVEVKMSSGSDGYVKVYRKTSRDSGFVEMGQLSGKNEDYAKDQYYVKMGIYTQHTEVQNMDMYVSNLKIVA